MKKVFIVLIILTSTVVYSDQAKKMPINPEIFDLSIPALSGIILSYKSWNTMNSHERTILITGLIYGLRTDYAYDIQVGNLINYIDRYYKTTGKHWQTVDRIIDMYLQQFEKVEPDYNVA